MRRIFFLWKKAASLIYFRQGSGHEKVLNGGKLRPHALGQFLISGATLLGFRSPLCHQLVTGQLPNPATRLLLCPCVWWCLRSHPLNSYKAHRSMLGPLQGWCMCHLLRLSPSKGDAPKRVGWSSPQCADVGQSSAPHGHRPPRTQHLRWPGLYLPLSSINNSIWHFLVNHAEKTRRSKWHLFLNVLPPCCLTASQYRLWSFCPLPEKTGLDQEVSLFLRGGPDCCQWRCQPQGARNWPWVVLVPPPIVTAVMNLAVDGCWDWWSTRVGQVSLWPRERPSSQPSPFPYRSLRSVSLGLRNMVVNNATLPQPCPSPHSPWSRSGRIEYVYAGSPWTP